MFIYTFQSLTFVLISTWEIFTICWIAFGVVTSEWQERDGGVVSCQNSDHCWYPAPESLSGHQVTSDHRGVWVTSDTISRHRGREEEWRQWYDRNMETRLTRGHSQDSGMSCILQTKDSWYPEGGLCDFHKPVIVHLERFVTGKSAVYSHYSFETVCLAIFYP